MTSGDMLTVIAILVTGAGSIASMVSIMLVLLQVRATQRIARGEFLLKLEEQMQRYQPHYNALIAEGGWSPGDNGITLSDMVLYMTLFEQMKLLIDLKILDFPVFVRLYSFRVIIVVCNDHVYNTLLSKNTNTWPDFIGLCKRLLPEAEKRTLFFKPQQDLFIERVRALPEPQPWH